MKKPKVLIVDDEQIIRDSLTAWLEDDDYEVLAAEDGMKALNVLGETPFDIAVLDIKMQGMDGITLLKKIHEKNSELPVVMMTVHATVESAEAC